MSPEDGPQLLLQAEKFLPHQIRGDVLACCPTMDLVATASKDDKVDVFRFNGQRAFGTQRRAGDEASVVKLAWKYNGQLLAVSWSDGTLEVLSAETGHAVQQFKHTVARATNMDIDSDNDDEHPISCIGWGTNFINVEAVMRNTGYDVKTQTCSDHLFGSDDWQTQLDSIDLDEYLDRAPDQEKLEIPVDLPEQLARIDVMAEFPKLPVLPLLPPAAYRGGDHSAAELFASQVSLDAAIHSKNVSHQNDVDTLMLCEDNAGVRVILYDALSLGSIDSAGGAATMQYRFLKHASHPFHSTHMFLTESRIVSENPAISIQPLQLGFLQRGGTHLQIIQSKTAELQYLVQYVGEALLGIHHHWQHALDLPSRFMKFVNEDLQEKDNTTLAQSLLHLACTGHCPPLLKEWLVDTLAERGHKRWDQSMNHGYTKVLEMTHENFLPALDRCNMVLVRLQGLFEYHNASFDVPMPLIQSILNIIECLRLLGHHILLFASREQRQFEQFSRWLRHEIDVQATDPTSSSAEETLEKDVGVDIRMLLDYIQGPLVSSKLSLLMPPTPKPAAITVAPHRYGDLKDVLEQVKTEKSAAQPELLNPNASYAQWQKLNATLAEKITLSQHKSCSLHTPISLYSGAVRQHDMRIVVRPSEPELAVTCVALVPEEQPERLLIFQLSQDRADISKRADSNLQRGQLVFQGFTITDIGFVDDKVLFILLSDDTTSRLISLPYMSGFEGSIISYQPMMNTKSTSLPPSTILDSSAVHSLTRHVFPSSDPFRPQKLAINGRKDRRCCIVLGEDGRSMKIFDLDWDHEKAEAFARDGAADSYHC